MENKKKIKKDEFILEKSYMNKKNEEFILFNKMFTGSFNENNIGHEIINCFKTDNGEEYIYILPYGGISKKLNNKVKYIINIGPLTNDRFEILSLIEESEQLYFGGNNGNIDSHNEQIEYIKNNNIKYGGKLLNEIMKDNFEDNRALYYTFKAKRIIKPKRRLFIIQEDIKNLFIDKQNNIHININVQRSKGKISNIINANIYDELVKNVIQNKNLWKNQDETQKINLNKFSEDVANLNFLKVISKEDEETIFTNMFFYFLKENPLLANKFIKSVIGLNEKVIKIEKEKTQLDYKQNEKTNEDKNISEIRRKHVDLWIETNNSIIVIENKIKSGINGLSTDKKISQLDNYYNYAEWYKEKYDKNKAIYCYIFVPNYNRELVERVKIKYKYGLNYRIITYKKLYEFFSSKEEKDICKNDKYYIDFTNALYKHTFAKDEELERRFVLKIKDSNK